MQLLKFELYKIFKQKIVYITFLFLLLFSTGFTFDRSTQAERDLYKEWEGPLTEAKVELAEKENARLNEIIDKRVEEGKEGQILTDTESLRSGIYEQIAFIKGSERQLKETYKTLDQENKYNSELGKSMIQKVDLSFFSYNKGPGEMIDYASFYSILLTGCMLLIGLSATYTQEYSSGVDHYMLSSRKGKETLLRSKIIASLIYTAVVVLVWEIFNLVWNGIKYGFEGWSTPIQHMFKYYFSPYSFTMLEFHLVQLCLHLLAAFAFALLIILVSSLCKNSLLSFFINAVIFAVPFFVVETMNFPSWLEDMFSFSFIYIMKIEFLFDHFKTINVWGAPLLYPIVGLLWVIIISAVLLLVTNKVIKNKEVTV